MATSPASSSTKPKVLLIGISGISCSGKTTLARLLRDIWPNTVILHEDDFYWPDKQIPVKNGVQDWDCLEAVDLAKLQAGLAYMKQHGEPPPDLDSKEDQNSVGESGVSSKTVSALKQEAGGLQSGTEPLRICIMDGFLLYSQSMNKVWELLDLRLFLHTSYEVAKQRREARTGYVTIDGFWEDPPGYVDDVVWPNYVREHQYLFVDGNVQGQVDATVCNEMQLHVMPEDAQQNMNVCLEWANEIVRSAVASRQS